MPHCSPRPGSCSRSRPIRGFRSSARTSSWTSATSSRWTGSRARDLQALLGAEGRPGLDPALAIGYLEQAAEALGHLHAHEPPVVHGDVKPANLILTSSGRIVLVDFGLSSRPPTSCGGRARPGTWRPRSRRGRDRPQRRTCTRSPPPRWRCSPARLPPAVAPSWGAIERERIPALERIVRRNLATDPARRDASAAAFVARLRRWWGADLPTGTVTLVLADVSAMPARAREASVDEVARAHRGHCVSPVDDGPLLVAFASAADGFDAARELAGGLGARVAAVTGEAEPRAGSYQGARGSRGGQAAEDGRTRARS